jgi:hypothetical protein
MNKEKENNDFKNLEMNWTNGTKVKVKQKHYEVTEKFYVEEKRILEKYG